MLLRIYVSNGEITVEHLLEGSTVYYNPANKPQSPLLPKPQKCA